MQPFQKNDKKIKLKNCKLFWENFTLIEACGIPKLIYMYFEYYI